MGLWSDCLTTSHFFCFSQCLSLGYESFHVSNISAIQGIMNMLVRHTNYRSLNSKIFIRIDNIQVGYCKSLCITSKDLIRTLSKWPQACQCFGLSLVGYKMTYKHIFKLTNRLRREWVVPRSGHAFKSFQKYSVLDSINCALQIQNALKIGHVLGWICRPIIHLFWDSKGWGTTSTCILSDKGFASISWSRSWSLRTFLQFLQLPHNIL